MASISDICRTIGALISTGINQAGLTAPNVVIVGWPSGPQAKSIFGTGKSMISIMPQNARRDLDQYRPEIQYLVNPTPTSLIATVVASSPQFWTITFSGTNAPALNIWTVAGPVPWANGATLYQTTGTETFDQIASAIATQLNLLSLLNVTATSLGPVISVTSATPLWCNIGQPINQTPTGEPIAVVDIGRFDQTVLITIWAPVPDDFILGTSGSREDLENACLLALGGNDQKWNIAPDASGFSSVWGNTGRWSDKPEDTYTVFRADLELDIVYSLYRTVTLTPVDVINVTSVTNNNSPQIEYVGGPLDASGDPNA